jgi:exopolyphosphatase/guanosine-5'-triphosphate,3'-diphosphate pyrophosphatase
MRIAAIDIGSNSLHMIVCAIRPDLSFEVIDREKDMIRLAAGTLGRGRLPEANIEAAMQSLAKFRRLAESHGVEEVLASATSAVREADNGSDLVTRARRELGLRIRVISGTEEARLIHLASAYAIGTGQQRAVTIDIGGGSTEIILGTSARMESCRSFKLGVIRLAERFGRSDPLSRKDEARLVRHIRRETAGFLVQIRRRGFTRVIGTSGTIQTLGTLASGAGTRMVSEVRRRAVDAGDLRRLRKRLVSLPLEARLQMAGLDPRRADLAPVGAVLLDALLDRLGASELTLCDLALREGLVLDYIRRNTSHIRTAERYPDVRRRSVVELAERCRYIPDHARQIARLSLALFDGTTALHGLGPREREWLEYAALLHDIGTHISYEDHHKHAYYLVKHGDLRGFDPEEVEVIALAARYHRQATPKKIHDGFGDLGRPLRRSVKLLGAILRLAEGLDRSHARVVGDLQVDQATDGLRVRLRTRGDAELELWAASRHAEPLSRLLEAPIRFIAGGRVGGRSATPRATGRARAVSPPRDFTAPKLSRNRPRRRVISR